MEVGNKRLPKLKGGKKKGFMGVVPDNHQETVFIFDNFSAVFSFETKFSRPSTILNTTASLIAQFDVN